MTLRSGATTANAQASIQIAGSAAWDRSADNLSRLVCSRQDHKYGSEHRAGEYLARMLYNFLIAHLVRSVTPAQIS
jgi:hypothetical protein